MQPVFIVGEERHDCDERKVDVREQKKRNLRDIARSGVRPRELPVVRDTEGAAQM